MTGNIRIYSIYTKRYFQYNKQTVKAHYIDSWYTRGFCSVWQVSNWKESGINYGTISDIYGKGEFYVSFNIGVGDLILQNDYVNFYIRCDKNGKYIAHFVEKH